jgi:hypothetical protein
MELLIIEQNGWKKPFKITKAITRVGSSPSNDIKLDSPEISPVQLQVLYSQDAPSSCKVLNLGGEIAVAVSGDEQRITSYATVELHDGDVISLGGFRLQVQMPLRTGILRSSELISASLVIADAVLRPEIPTFGRLILKNNGDRQACQFQVEIKGMPFDCYQIDPIPLLFPGAEEEVRVQFIHHGIYPAAGLLNVTLVVTAPSNYPGEQIVIQQGLYVNPVFDQQLEIRDDMEKQIAPQPVISSQPASPPDTSQLNNENRMPVQEKAEIQQTGSEAQPLAEGAPGPRVEEPVKPKVVRNPSESYWNENTG